MLTDTQTMILNQVAARIGIPPAWLYAVIQTESSWDPQANNGTGNLGLIQFNDAAAKQIGYNSAADLISQNGTIEAQLQSPVLAYYTTPPNEAPFADFFDFCLATILPHYRGSIPSTPWPASVAQRGYQTLADYAADVARNLPGLTVGQVVTAAAIAAGVIAVLIGARNNH
jgi:hypothetical protein